MTTQECPSCSAPVKSVLVSRCSHCTTPLPAETVSSEAVGIAEKIHQDLVLLETGKSCVPFQGFVRGFLTSATFVLPAWALHRASNLVRSHLFRERILAHVRLSLRQDFSRLEVKHKLDPEVVRLGQRVGEGIKAFDRARLPLKRALWRGMAIGAVCMVAELGFLWATLGSAANDEISTPKKEISDFVAWRKGLEGLVSHTGGVEALRLPPAVADRHVGWFASCFELPSRRAVDAALDRRVPAFFRVTSIRPLSYEPAEGGEGLAVVYAVTLQAKDDIYAVSVQLKSQASIDSAEKLPARAAALPKLLLFADDLPAGFVYGAESRTLLLAQGQTMEMTWRVNRAERQKWVWKVLDADPLPIQTSGRFESKLLAFSDGKAPILLLRSGIQIEQGKGNEQAAMVAFRDRVDGMERQIADFRAARLSEVPGVRSFGGDGSGEPTKTGARIGGGAATGAGIGAMAGGGQGAGWGALGGAILGGIYDAVSKSNDKKKFDAEQQSAHAMAVRRAEARAAEYADGLYATLVRDLRAKADEHARKLMAN